MRVVAGSDGAGEMLSEGLELDFAAIDGSVHINIASRVLR
jgi:hypothetical protein